MEIKLLLWLAGVMGAGAVSVSGVNLGAGLLEQADAGVAPLWADFSTELNAIEIPASGFSAAMPEERSGYSRAVNSFAQTLTVELEELREALSGGDVPMEKRKGIIEAHRRERELLREKPIKSASGDFDMNSLEGLTAESRWDEDEFQILPLQEGPENYRRSADAAMPQVTEGLPGEMAEYFRGLILLHFGDVEEAREVWRELLAWPEPRRPYRTVWATYMLGRSFGDEPESLPYYRHVRELARAGWRDPLGLAAASLGWEARVRWKQGNHGEALRLYLQQWQAGDPTALPSLRQVAADALQQDEAAMAGLMADEIARKIVTAYLCSARSVYYEPKYGKERVLAWLEMAETTGLRDAAAAERLALIAYQSEAFDIAGQWLSRARPDSPAMRWLEAKLLLRAGEITPAMDVLNDLADRFPLGTGSDEVFDIGGTDFVRVSIRGYRNLLVDLPAGVRADLAVALFAKEDYVNALHRFMEGNRWLDAAYVAERVLPTDAVREYVEAHWPEERMETWRSVFDEERYLRYGFVGSLRPLLGRRLAREGRYEEARIFLPEAVREELDAFAAHLRAGSDDTTSTEDRAAALWAAAQIARRAGMELFGTELGPDWSVYDGGFVGNMTPENRSTEGVAAIAASELEAVALTEAVPNRRYHYRYMAADLAWRAAEAMPDNSDETAMVLYTAGLWLKNRDPEAADRFYKALVLRCGTTILGREAARLRWFPPNEGAS